jgi:predicted Fe-S protein YdhL (DUF1289 family)
MDPATGLCEGCQRTLEEIAAWAQLADADKLAVMAAVERRRQALFEPLPQAPPEPRP